ncbi:MAG: cytochrome c oxidase subunit 2A [bacterium]|nr:cytochrome c oxidase subunit 2A [bacterium]MCP4964830.1 cytochrome c oxidase subunit 2A [bacterium]
MTTEGDNGNETEGEFKPTGTVAFVAAFVVVLMLMWFSIYIILLSRGATI